MRRLTVLLVATALVAGAGCSSEGDDDATPASTTTAPTTAPAVEDCASVEPGRTEETLTSGGVERTYVRYVPEAEGPLPLVVDLTAYSPAAVQEGISGWTRPGADGTVPADEVGAVVVTPDPIGGAGDLLTWNLTDQPGWADDDLFVADLLAALDRDLCLDAGRTLVTGFAIGGVFASRLACTMADEVEMVAVVAGLDDPPDCAPTRPVPVLAFHGTGDRFLPYDGGVGAGAGGLPLSPETTAGLVDVVARRGPVTEAAAAWAERNGCTTRPSPAPPGAVTTAAWAGCDADASVELVTIEGGEHTWPGSTTMADLVPLLGPVSELVAATDLIWERFSEATA